MKGNKSLNLTCKKSVVIKKTAFLLIFAMLALTFLSACSKTKNWSSVDIDGYGAIKVPEGWTTCVEDEYMYVFSEKDGERSNILVQYESAGDINRRLADIKNMTLLQSEFFSNSAFIEKYKIDYQDGRSEELFVLSFTGPNDYRSTDFLCVDTSVAEDTLRLIAKSYIMFKA